MRSKTRPEPGRGFGDTLNEVQLLGYLGADPEVYSTKTNCPCAIISVRTNNDYVNSEAQIAEWHRVVCWKSVAELVAQFKKGTKVLVKGRLTYYPYPKQTETNHKRAEIVAWAVIPMSRFKDEVGPEKAREDGYVREESTHQSSDYDVISAPTASDDIPF